ncbi:hypothetical protein FNV43_RR08308 [Rhamnella rubrinervis]|uniref:Cytochrome c assembly protein domain-containing protein n=1 Tax=Rhamnella rubrinervis TaxID=2594499 RepID=A0A8K0MNT8_9ROSA|nr:hypothetical protein FNV43_RR08308 [Rhamnella rubrinervis]
MHPLPCLVIPVDHNPLDPLMGAEHRNVSKDRSKEELPGSLASLIPSFSARKEENLLMYFHGRPKKPRRARWGKTEHPLVLQFQVFLMRASTRGSERGALREDRLVKVGTSGALLIGIWAFWANIPRGMIEADPTVVLSPINVANMRDTLVENTMALPGTDKIIPSIDAIVENNAMKEGNSVEQYRVNAGKKALACAVATLVLGAMLNNLAAGHLTRSYAQILIGSRLFLTAMAIHLSLRVAPLDLQQGGNSRIPYVHVPAARMSILVYIATAINTFFFLLTKHPLFLRSSGTGTEMGAFFTLFTLVTGGFRGRPMWGTFWVWDARLTSVFISFLIYLGALRFQKLPVEPASISIRAGPIDIPIIKSSVNWWNTSHQPGSISRSGTSIHVPMPIPILSNFANSPLSTRILFVLETRLPIPSFPESPLTEEIEAREGIPKPSSLAESPCIHG